MCNLLCKLLLIYSPSTLGINWSKLLNKNFYLFINKNFYLYDFLYNKMFNVYELICDIKLVNKYKLIFFIKIPSVSTAEIASITLFVFYDVRHFFLDNHWYFHWIRGFFIDRVRYRFFYWNWMRYWYRNLYKIFN